MHASPLHLDAVPRRGANTNVHRPSIHERHNSQVFPRNYERGSSNRPFSSWSAQLRENFISPLARSAIFAELKTPSNASCALSQTGCAGHQLLRGHGRRLPWHTLRRIGPSMASTTSRIDARRPVAEISKPPDGPRRDVISRARARPWSTLDRKLSGAPVVFTILGSGARFPGRRAARNIITRTA